MYKVFAPTPQLRPYVELYMVHRGHVPSGRLGLGPVPVDGQAELVLNFGDPYQQATGMEAAPTPVAKAHVYGPRTVPLRLWQIGYHFAVAVRFNPGGISAFIAGPATDYADQLIAANDMLGRAINDMEEQLFECARRDLDTVPSILDDFLLHRLRPEATRPLRRDRLRAALGHVRATHGTIGISTLADRLGVSTRSLRRLFCERVGLAPKMYTRSIRLRYAFRLARETDLPLAAVALEAGYADQAHFTREAVGLSGQSPAMLRANG